MNGTLRGAHKDILRDGSLGLREILKDERYGLNFALCLHDPDIEALEAMLNFMYTNDDKILETTPLLSRLQQMMRMAEKYRTPKLAQCGLKKFNEIKLSDSKEFATDYFLGIVNMANDPKGSSQKPWPGFMKIWLARAALQRAEYPGVGRIEARYRELGITLLEEAGRRDYDDLLEEYKREGAG
ncbi:hypothetical protein BDV25DRAFT_135549 [Aspergillus avenaceus]|uniref:BTB domain-containing protein n=1 Tax=Aspergillus avenaceus TaxID=36643 RepID=A0A5N6U8J8_ASPAV|nr:hypothetical protein BDV25DRAFT_135549 [Aspergillus avenaceus]